MSASERIPLIEETDRDDGCIQRIQSKYFPSGYWAELYEIVKISTPVLLVQLTQYLISPVALMFCGRLGKAELDGVAMANSMINVLGISIATGLGTACDTLFSQIYGSPYKRNMGIALQRSILVLLLFVFPCWAIHLNIENILLALGQDDEVAKLSAEYMLIFLPALLAFFVYICLQKYLMNQNVIYPNLVVGVICNVINIVLHYVLVVQLQYGIKGSAISQLVSYVMFLLLTLIYIRVSKIYEDTWTGWSAECLMEWGQFIKLAMFGVALVCVEWWSFEIGVFLSGVMGTTELGAQSVIFQVESMSYMFPLGVGIGGSIRVGQFLGARRREAAKTAANVAVSMIAVVGLVLGILLITLRDYLPLIFTNVSEVITLASSLLPILGIYMVFDSMAGVCNGILRGSGRQLLGAGIVAVCYAIALSVGIPLMFLTSLGVAGYWWGLALGLFIECVVFTTIILRTDWSKQVAQARERTQTRKPISRLSVSVSMTEEAHARFMAADDDEADTYLAPTCSTLPRDVKTRRVLTLMASLAILAVGAICRVLIPVTNPYSGGGQVEVNSTAGYIDFTTLTDL